LILHQHVPERVP